MLRSPDLSVIRQWAQSNSAIYITVYTSGTPLRDLSIHVTNNSLALEMPPLSGGLRGNSGEHP